MEITIDRIEEKYVVIELPTKEFINVDKRLFLNFKEGDIIDITLNKEKTDDRKKKISLLMNELFK